MWSIVLWLFQVKIYCYRVSFVDVLSIRTKKASGLYLAWVDFDIRIFSFFLYNHPWWDFEKFIKINMAFSTNQLIYGKLILFINCSGSNFSGVDISVVGLEIVEGLFNLEYLLWAESSVDVSLHGEGRVMMSLRLRTVSHNINIIDYQNLSSIDTIWFE